MEILILVAGLLFHFGIAFAGAVLLAAAYKWLTGQSTGPSLLVFGGIAGGLCGILSTGWIFFNLSILGGAAVSFAVGAGLMLLAALYRFVIAGEDRTDQAASP